MSPVATRFAARAVQRRNMSMMTSMRRWAQTFEAHPFERIPVASNPQSGDYGKMFKRSATSLAFYVPGLAVLLGWPYASAKLLQGHV